MSKNNTSTLPTELGTARWIGTFKNNSLEWHAQRAKAVGGSDAGVLAGLSPWESPYTWAAKRLGKIEDSFEQNEAMFWGTTLESTILDVWGADHYDLTLHREVGTWQHVDRAWQQANPDAIWQQGDEYGIVEVKTARYEDGWNEKTGEIPPHYRAQVLWYLQTFGFRKAYVVVLFAGSKLRTFEIEFNQFEADSNLQAVEIVWRMVEADNLPDFSAPFISTFETVRKQHPDIDPDGSVELGDLFIHYSNAVADEDKAKEHANELRARVLDAMGNAKNGTFEDKVVVTRQSRNGGTPYLVNKKR